MCSALGLSLSSLIQSPYSNACAMFTQLAIHLHLPITTGTTHGKHLIELAGIVHQILNTYQT